MCRCWTVSPVSPECLLTVSFLCHFSFSGLWNKSTICLTELCILLVFQVEVSPLPEALSNCVRPDSRVPPAYSQSCTNYRADKHITYAFLYPPRKWAPAAELTQHVWWRFYWIRIPTIILQSYYYSFVPHLIVFHDFIYHINPVSFLPDRTVVKSRQKIRCCPHHQHCSHVSSIQE